MSILQVQPKPYKEVLGLYDAARERSPAFSKMTLPEYAQFMQKNTGTTLFDAGFEDSNVKRFSVGLDKLIETTGAPKLTKSLGAGIGSLISPKFAEVGAAAGEAVPRSIVNMLPLIAAAPFTGGGSLAPAVLGAAGAGALTAADTYTQTGSGKGAIASGVGAALLPKVAKAGAQATLKALGVEALADDIINPLTGKLLGKAGERIATTFPQRAAMVGGENLAAMIESEVAGQATSALSGQGFYNPVSPEHLFESLIGNAAFAPLTIPDLVTAHPAAGIAKYMQTERRSREKAIVPYDFSRSTMGPDQPNMAGRPGKGSAPIFTGGSNELGSRQAPLALPYTPPDLRVFDLTPEQTRIVALTDLRGGKSAEESAQVINQQLAADEQLRQSPQGAAGLKQQLASAQSASPVDTDPRAMIEALRQKYNFGSTAPSAEDVRNSLITTQGVRMILNDNGAGLPVGDAEIAKRVQSISQANPHISDPVAAAAESIRTETLRKADAKLLEAQKDLEFLASRDPQSEDLQTVARVVASQGDKQLIGGAEKIYSAFRKFKTERGDAHTQEELGAYIGKAAKNADIESKRDIAGKQVSIDAAETAGDRTLFTQLDKANDQGVKQLENNVTSALKDDVPEARNAVAVDLDARLTTTLSKLNDMEDIAPGLWRQVFKKNPEVGKQRMEVYIRSVYDAMEGGRKLTPKELHEAMVRYDAQNGTNIAYGSADSLRTEFFGNGKAEKVLQYIESQPDLGVEGLKGTRANIKSTESPVAVKTGLMSTREFFKRLFQERHGDSITVASRQADELARLTALFSTADNVRIGELKSAVELGVYVASKNNPLWTGLVGIATRFAPESEAQRNFMYKFTLGHELTHQADNLYALQKSTGVEVLPKRLYEAIQKMDETSEVMGVEDRASMIAELAASVVPKAQLTPELRALLAASADTPEEFRATMGSLIATSTAGTKAPRSFIKDLLTYVPKGIADWVGETIRYIRKMTGALYSGATAQRIGTTADGSLHSDALKQYIKTFDELLRDVNEADQAVAQLLRYEATDPQNYQQVLQHAMIDPISEGDFDGPAWARDAMRKVAEEEERIKPGFFAKNIMPAYQIAEKFPIFRNMVDITNNVRAKINLASSNLSELLLTKTSKGGVTVDLKGEHVKRFAESDKMRRVFSELALKQQDVGRLLTVEEKTDILKKSGMSDTAIEDTLSVFESVSDQMLETSNIRMRAEHEFNGIAIAQLIQRAEPQRRSKETAVLGKRIFDAAYRGDVAALQRDLSGLNPDVAVKVGAVADSLADSTKALQAFYDSRPWYFSERRFGEYFIRYKKKDGSLGGIGAENDKHLAARVKEIEKEGGSVIEVQHEQKGSANNKFGMSSDYTQMVEQLERTREAKLQAAFADRPELLEQLKPFMGLDAELRTELQANDMTKAHKIRRKTVAGREKLDMFEVQQTHMAATIRAVAKKYARMDTSLHLLDADFVNNPEMAQLARQYVDNFLTPDSELGSKLANINFMYMIGGNLSTMTMEPFQALSAVAPALTREGAGVIQGYKLVAGATKKVLHSYVNKSFASKEHQTLIDSLRAAKAIDKGYLDEFDSQGLAAINSKRMAKDLQPASKLDIFKNPVYHIIGLARNMYGHVTRHNAEVTAIAAYDLFRSKGMDVQRATQEARRVVDYTNFGGGQANRPVGLWNVRGEMPRTAVHALTSLQGYQLNMIAMMARMVEQGFSSKAKLLPFERTAAKKAAIQMLATQAALAGGIGMPFAGAGMALIAQIFPGLNPEKEIRELIAGLSGNDTALGSLIADLALNGAINTFTPVDFSSRYALGNVLGVSAYNGFDIANLAGPTGSIVSNAFKAVQDASMGDPLKAVEDIVPISVKRVINSYREGGEFRDNAGNLLFEGTPTEKMLRVMGYTPSREASLRKQQTLLKRSQEIDSREMSTFYNRLATMYREGRLTEVKAELLNREKSDPTFDPVAGTRELAKRVEAQTVPVDVRRTGSLRNATEQQALQRTYGKMGAPTEMDRLMLRQKVEGSLGITGAGAISPTEMRIAEGVDYLMRLYPTLTRSQAVALTKGKVSEGEVGLE